MTFRMIIVFVGFFMSFVWAGGCNDKDEVIFSCQMENSYFYICSNEGEVNYKHFKKGVNDFVYPEEGRRGEFYLSSTGYSGGGEIRIEFNQKGYLYSIYDKVVKVERNGEIYPEFESGIEVVKNNIVISKKECLSSSGINQILASKFFKSVEP